MSTKTQKQQEWALASVALQDAYTDFILSRQAMLCSPTTIRWYGFTAGRFIQWVSENGVTEPSEITARHVRAYLATLAERELTDSYINGNARAVKTFLRFCHAEGYTDQAIKFSMPRIEKKRMAALTEAQLKKLLAHCYSVRDLALVLFMVDTGVRRAELCALKWGDANLENGTVRIARGKGKKARSVIVGIKTRRALLKYRRTISHRDNDALFQTVSGTGIKPHGLRSLLLRVGKRAGIDLSPHMLRRTFATLSLRAGMNPLHLQGLLGHSSLEMTRRYVLMLDDDLLAAHQEHGPIDRWV